MRTTDQPTSPSFPKFEPLILNSDMGSLGGDNDFNCFDPAVLESSASNPNHNEFEDLFFRPPSSAQMSDAMSCFSEITSKATGNDVSSNVAESSALSPPEIRSESPEDSSNGSLSNSPVGHTRNASLISNPSEVFSPGSIGGTDHFLHTSWTSPEDSSFLDGNLGQNADFSSAKSDYVTEADIEMSNKAMDSAFDFDSAASSPSPLVAEARVDMKATHSPSNETLQTSAEIFDKPPRTANASVSLTT